MLLEVHRVQAGDHERHQPEAWRDRVRHSGLLLHPLDALTRPVRRDERRHDQDPPEQHGEQGDARPDVLVAEIIARLADFLRRLLCGFKRVGHGKKIVRVASDDLPPAVQLVVGTDDLLPRVVDARIGIDEDAVQRGQATVVLPKDG